MSGPKPPGSDAPDSPEPGEEPTSGESTDHVDDADAPRTGETEAYSQAYSAPESEQITSAPYVPANPALYDYDSYPATDLVERSSPPRWPWVVGVTAILAAIALVVSVTVLVARTDSSNLANPETSTTSPRPPVQDEITTTTPPPPPPPPSSEPPPPPPPTEEPPPPPDTVTVTEPPPPPPSEAPPATTQAPPPTTTTPAGPRQLTYSITGTKAPGDIITVTFMDAQGNRKTQRNVFIPWTMTVTPISVSDVGSVEASSLFLVSRLNCSITASDGTVLSSNSGNAARTSC